MLKLQFVSKTAVMLMALGCSGGSTTSSATGGAAGTCPPGSEQCPCYADGTCNNGLECRSSLCVTDSGVTGGSSSVGGGANGGATSSGGTASGGTSTSSVGNGGGSIAEGGTSSFGGAQSLGGTSNAGGATSNAGTSSCGDTTSDWQNCGNCGRVCTNKGEGCGTACCVAGVCNHFWGPCFTKSSGFTTCAAACASVGAVCLAKGCGTGGYTWFGWGAATSSRCSTILGPGTTSAGSCDVALPFSGESSTVRCCCAEP